MLIFKSLELPWFRGKQTFLDYFLLLVRGFVGSPCSILIPVHRALVPPGMRTGSGSIFTRPSRLAGTLGL